MPVPHLHAKPCMGTPHYGRPTSVAQRGDVQDYAAKGRRPMEGLKVGRCQARRNLRSSEHAGHL